MIHARDSTKTGSIRSDLASLAAAGEPLPKRVPLHPFGAFKGNGKDYLFDDTSLELIKEQLAERGNLFVVDWHHQTLDQEKGERDDAPAAFWIKDIIVDDGYVYGVVESWTPKAEAAVRSKEYRYLSAVFPYEGDSGRVLGYHSFGLLNRPGTHYQRVIGLAAGPSDRRLAVLEMSFSDIRLLLHGALEERFGEDYGWVEEVYDDHIIVQTEGGELVRIEYHLEQDKAVFDSEPVEVTKSYTEVQTGVNMNKANLTLAVLTALALSDSASESEVIAAIAGLKNFEKELLSLTNTSDRESAYGSLTALKAKADKADALQAQLNTHKAEAEKSDREGLIKEALTAKKLSPAQAKEGGFARTVPLATLKAFLKDAPTIIAGEVKEPGAATPKAWADMTGVEKAALYQDNPELYKSLRKTALGY